MKAIILSNWVSQDIRGLRSYVTSYTLRSPDSELFTIHLNRQLGFYQISEFVSATGGRNFIIEQTNRVGTPKIAAFDKESGAMLGVFKGNSLLDPNENLVFDIRPMESLASTIVCPTYQDHSEDYAGVLHHQDSVAVIFSQLPHKHVNSGVLARIKRLSNRLTHAPQDVLEVMIVDEDACDLRMVCAISVILHSRGGLHVK